MPRPGGELPEPSTSAEPSSSSTMTTVSASAISSGTLRRSPMPSAAPDQVDDAGPARARELDGRALVVDGAGDARVVSGDALRSLDVAVGRHDPDEGGAAHG